MIKYLLVYSWQSYAGSGTGRSFGTANGLVSEEAILEWERIIREANHFNSVMITNFQPLAS
jgi:hypothetical protein